MFVVDERVRAHALTIEITQRLLQRFWAKVRKSAECWEWQASTRMGYGALKVAGVVWEAHRLAWLFAHARIPEGKYVCHHCDNRRCVRAAHLFLATPKENHSDMVEKGRQIVICGENVGKAVLSESLVREIWRLRRSLGWGSRRIGRVLEVSNDAVEAVLSGRSWRHVEVA